MQHLLEKQGYDKLFDTAPSATKPAHEAIAELVQALGDSKEPVSTNSNIDAVAANVSSSEGADVAVASASAPAPASAEASAKPDATKPSRASKAGKTSRAPRPPKAPKTPDASKLSARKASDFSSWLSEDVSKLLVGRGSSTASEAVQRFLSDADKSEKTYAAACAKADATRRRALAEGIHRMLTQHKGSKAAAAVLSAPAAASVGASAGASGKRRPKTGRDLFCSDKTVRADFKREHELADSREVSRKLGARYNDMTSEERAKWETAAAAAAESGAAAGSGSRSKRKREDGASKPLAKRKRVSDAGAEAPVEEVASGPKSRSRKPSSKPAKAAKAAKAAKDDRSDFEASDSLDGSDNEH